jgi:hypothetical protein
LLVAPQPAGALEMTQPAVQQDTEIHVVHSDIMDFDFQIFIHRPLEEIVKPLPLVYVTTEKISQTFNASDQRLLR